jgi:hypothetical protein
MIFTRLAGGLGNQLFQLAAALALQESCGGRIFLGTNSLRRYKAARAYELSRLLRLPPTCLAQPIAMSWAPAVERLMALRLGRLLPSFGVNDRTFKHTLAMATAKRRPCTLWLDGYFQQGWGWPEFSQVHSSMVSMLRDDLPLPPTPMPDCTIHVRGGDFLASEQHAVVGTAFYRQALGVLMDQQPDTRSVWIVTDDKRHAAVVRTALAEAFPRLAIDWAPDGPRGWMHDFVLLRDSASRILGNSTFSWWAAAMDLRQVQTFTPNQWTRGIPRTLYLPWETAVPA